LRGTEGDSDVEQEWVEPQAMLGQRCRSRLAATDFVAAADIAEDADTASSAERRSMLGLKGLDIGPSTVEQFKHESPPPDSIF
jgi:3-phosphoglycerate kinase